MRMCRSILQGLGTVQAFYTVTVTARVDGELQKVAFTEGQTVHKGDLLAQIDPRPNQAAYEQAVADQGEGRGAARQRQARSRALHRACSRRIWRASRPSTRSARWSISSAPSSRSTRPSSTTPARSSTTRASPRRSTAAPAFAWSIRATSCMRAATTGIVVVTQVQPIAVIFTLPEEESRHRQRGARRGTRQGDDGFARRAATELDQGTLDADRQ